VHEASYTFERPVLFNDSEGKTTTNFINLYKQHCFVLEAKQGSDKAIQTKAELLGAEKVKTKTDCYPRYPHLGTENKARKRTSPAVCTIITCIGRLAAVFSGGGFRLLY
jgi:hypothetical protein